MEVIYSKGMQSKATNITFRIVMSLSSLPEIEMIAFKYTIKNNEVR